MPGPDDRKVASINSRDPRDAQPLGGRDHDRVRAAEVCIKRYIARQLFRALTAAMTPATVANA